MVGERLAVLRSTKALENVIENMPEPNKNKIKIRKVQSVASSSNSIATFSADESTSVVTEENTTDEFTSLQNTITEKGGDTVALEEIVESTDNGDPLRTIKKSYVIRKDDVPVNPISETIDYTPPTMSDVLTSEKIELINTNNVLSNNYIDDVRGNVFRSYRMDSMYSRFLDAEDAKKMWKGEFVPIGEHRRVIQSNESARKNMIVNPFAGVDISNGCAISMWVRYMNPNMKSGKYGLLLFVDPYQEHIHPNPNYDGGPLRSNRFLYVHTNLDTLFEALFMNKFYGENKTELKSFEFNWNHLIFSFTNEGINVYLNGEPLELNEFRGKRFHTNENEGEFNKLGFTITDFLSQEDTCLFLGTTLVYESKNLDLVSDSILYDDITFYQNPVDEGIAKEMFSEALRINLP